LALDSQRSLNTGELVAVDGEQNEESRPGLFSWEVAGSGPVPPPIGADSERNTVADDPCLEARLGSGVSVRQVEAGEAPLQQVVGCHRRLAGESESLQVRARDRRGGRSGAASMGVAQIRCCRRTEAKGDESQFPCTEKEHGSECSVILGTVWNGVRRLNISTHPGRIHRFTA